MIVLLVLFTACEQTVDISDLPQQEDKLVVYGGLTVTPDSVFTSFWFQRTGTLAEHYRPEDHVVTDVDFSLCCGSGEITLREAETHALENWRIDYRRKLASSLRSGATARAADFDLTFFWKDKSIPVRIAAPVLPVSLGDVKLWKSHTDSATYLISYSYPVPKQNESVWIEFWEYDSEAMEWQWRSSRPVYPELIRGRLWADTVQLWSKSYTATASPPRYRYRISIENAYCEIGGDVHRRSDIGYPETQHSPLDPQGVNPPFNVTGDGIGFVSYRRFGGWIEIPY